MARKDFAAMEARRPSGDNAARAALRSRMAHPTSLRLDELQPNPLNPRYRDDDPEVRDLADTLLRVGQLQPALIVSREQYLTAYPAQASNLGPQPWVVLVGNRRLVASVIASRPALDVRVAADLDTAEAFEDRILIENIQRKALPPLLEAEHLQRRLSRPGQTMRTVGEAIGKSHAYVQQRLDLLKLIPEFQAMLRAGTINIKTGRRLGALPPEDQHARFAAGAPYLDDARPTPSKNPAPGPEPRLDAEPAEGVVNPVYNTPPDDSAADTERVAVGNPVYNGRSADSAAAAVGNPPPAQEDSVNPVYNTDAGPDAGPRAPAPAAPETGRRESTGERDTEQVRLSVTQWLDSALAELDAVLPGQGTSTADRALVESQRHILAARKVLGQ